MESATNPATAYLVGLLEAGFRLVPVNPKTKAAKGAWKAPDSGVRDATNAHKLHAGSGIVCEQRPDGLWIGALDCDSAEVAEAVLALVQDRVYCERTPKGLHVPFLSTIEVRTRRLAPDVEIRGHPSLLVSYPTPGYTQVNTFDWIVAADGGLWAVELAREAGIKVEDRSPKLRDLLRDDRYIAEGERNEQLMLLNGALRRLGFHGEWLHAALMGINERRCVPPLADERIRSMTVEWEAPEPAYPYHGEMSHTFQMHPGLHLPDPPPDLIDGFIPGRSNWITAVFGAEGHGKSQIMQLASICLAAGVPFLGATTRGPVAVHYHDWELNESEFFWRVGRICKGLGIPVPSNLWYTRHDAPITDPSVWRTIREQAVVQGLGFQVLDSVSGALAGVDLDRHYLVTPWLLRLRGMNIPTGIVQHQSKAFRDRTGKWVYPHSALGSGQQGAFARQIWQCFRTDEGYDHMGVTLTHRKYTSGHFEGSIDMIISGLREGEAMTFELDTTEEQEVRSVLIHSPEGLSMKGLHEATGIHPAKLYRMIKRPTMRIIVVRKEGRTPYYGVGEDVA